MKTLLKALPAFFALAALLAATPTPSAAAAGDRALWAPSPFHNDLDATIATDGNDLWMATIGENRKGKVYSAVARFRAGHWSRLGRPSPSSSGNFTFLALLPGRKTTPCLGDATPKGAPRIRCLESGRWRTLGYPARFRRGMLQGANTRAGHLEATFSRTTSGKGGQRTEVGHFRFRRGQARPVGRPIHRPGLWSAGVVPSTRDSRRQPLRVELWNPNNGNRVIFTCTQAGWHHSTMLAGRGQSGSRGTTAVNADGTLVSPFSQIVTEEFYGGRSESTMEVSLEKLNGTHWRQIGDGPINEGPGSAQGGVFPVGQRVWAVWVQNSYEGVGFGGMMPTKYFAARLNRSLTGFDRKLELWSGQTDFPGLTQAVEYRGGVAFLYPRQRTSRGGQHATVDLRFSD